MKPTAWKLNQHLNNSFYWRCSWRSKLSHDGAQEQLHASTTWQDFLSPLPPHPLHWTRLLLGQVIFGPDQIHLHARPQSSVHRWSVPPSCWGVLSWPGCRPTERTPSPSLLFLTWCLLLHRTATKQPEDTVIYRLWASADGSVCHELITALTVTHGSEGARRRWILIQP